MKNKFKFINIERTLLKIIVYLLLIIAAIIFTYKYVINEAPIYIFDYSGYFEHFKNLGNTLTTSFSAFLKSVYISMQQSDYNLTSVVPLMPIYILFGSSRYWYILSLVLIYLIPSVIVIELISKHIFIKEDKNYQLELLFPVFVLLLSFIYTRLWSPTLRGLSDICGLLFISISYLIILKKPLNKKNNPLWMILLGFCIYIPFLFRRWYAYYVVSFLISLFIFDLYNFVKSCDNKFNAKQFKIYFINYLYIGLSIIISAILLQYSFLKRIINENYGEMYSSFQTTLKGHIDSFINEFGYVIVTLLIISIVLSLLKKKYRKENLFCLSNILIFSIMFSRVQMMGVHHYLGISLFVIISVIIGLRLIFESINQKSIKLLFLIFILVIFSINFSTTYIFRNKSVKYISQNNKYYKFRYENFDELQRLIEDLKNISMDDSDKNIKFSVISDSEILSDNLIYLLGDYNIRDNIVYTNHVDSRDDITVNALLTEYVVVTNFAQTGTNENGQHVISIPNDYIFKSEKFGNNYMLYSGPYYLDNDVQAYIYRKKGAISIQDANNYFNVMYKYNKKWKEQYDDLTKRLLSSNISLGSYFGSFAKIDKQKTLLLYPGGTDTIIDIPVNDLKGYVYMKFYMKKENGRADAKISIKLDKKEIFTDLVSTSNSKNISFEINGNKNITIILNKNTDLLNDYFYIDYDFIER